MCGSHLIVDLAGVSSHQMQGGVVRGRHFHSITSPGGEFICQTLPVSFTVSCLLVFFCMVNGYCVFIVVPPAKCLLSFHPSFFFYGSFLNNNLSVNLGVYYYSTGGS